MDDYNAKRILNQTKKPNKGKKKDDGPYIHDHNSFMLDSVLEKYKRVNKAKKELES